MPFIVRCPNQPCQKYNLVEDERRGKTVDCLVCGTTMRVDTEPPPPPESPDSAAASVIRVCPQCNAKLRIPTTAKSQRIKCPKCQTVFE